jgi:hypothetical protein
VSSYERAHPLVPPASMRNAPGAHMLKLTRGKKGEKAREMKTSLGRRLNELEVKLDLKAKIKGGAVPDAGVNKGDRRKSGNLNGRTTRPSHGARF